MTTQKYIINTPKKLESFFEDARFLYSDIKYMNATISDKRSLDQNALKEVWYKDISTHRGDVSINEARRECKLKHGVTILRRDSPMNNWLYEKSLDLLPYEKQLIMMDAFGITSEMSTSQMKEYLSEINLEYPALESKPKGYASSSQS